MKRNLFFLLSLMLIVFLGACAETENVVKPDNQEVPEVEGPVDIDQDVMTITDGSTEATITLEADGYTASYGDFNVKYKKPEMMNGEVVAVGFSEWTSEDYLDIRVEILGYRHQLETYTRNGEVLQLEIIDQVTDEQYKLLENFLDDHNKSNSVTNNSDGHVLAGIMESNWDDIEYAISAPENNLAKRPAWGDFVCGVATACVATKCWFGGLLNTACGVCTSTVASCAIMDALGWW